MTEIIIDTLSVGNALSSNSVVAEDIYVDGISVKDCVGALGVLSGSVLVDIGGHRYNLVGKEL